MAENHRVSVVIPTLHRPNFLDGAIETVLNQTYDPIEVIVVNDDSTDEETKSVLSEYSSDDKIIIRHNETRKGLSGSRNQAAEIAEGDYLCILDDDDRWEPEKVQKQVDIFEEESDEVGVVYTEGDQRNAEGEITNTFNVSEDRIGDIWPQILYDWDMDPHSGHMIRASAFENVGGYDESLTHGEDWDLSIRLAKKYNFAAVRECLTHKIDHETNISMRRSHADLRQSILLKHGAEIFDDKDLASSFFSLWYQRLGRHDMRQGNWASSVRNQIISFGYDPKPRTALDLCICLSGPYGYRLASYVQGYIR